MEDDGFFEDRLDADREMAELYAVGRQVSRARKRGICCHGSAVGYVGKIIYPEQDGLKPGQLRCTETCGRVFDSDEDWATAAREARS